MRGRNLLDAIHNEFRFPIIIALAILLFVNASGKINIDLLLDRTPQENINIFLKDIDNINPKKVAGEEKTGLSIYDENRVLYNMMYEMGQREYLVYVFTKDISIDDELNLIVSEYKRAEGSLDVYGINVNELVGTIDSYMVPDAPFVLKLTRDNSVSGETPMTSVTGIYSNKDEVKEFLFKDVVLEDSSLGGTVGTGTDTNTDTNTENVPKKEKEKSESKEGSLWDNLFKDDSFLGKLFKDGELR